MNKNLIADRLADEVTAKEDSTKESHQASSVGESNHCVNASISIRFKLLVLDLLLP